MKTLLLVLLVSVSLFAQDLTLKKGFVAAHTQMVMDSTIDPLNTALQAKVSMQGEDLSSLKGEFWIEMGLFSSDNADRDEHMHEANEITKFPFARYTLTGVTPNAQAGSYNLEGILEFHGVKKPFNATAEITQDDKEIMLSATSQINVTNFDMQMPCMLFMCVRDEVDIFAKAVFVKP